MYQLAVILHLLGATVWTGGHLVLATTVLPRALRARDPAILSRFEHGYEKLGIPALIVQIATGLWLAHHHLPDVGAWFSFESSVAVHIFLKLALLAGTVGLAVDARLRLVHMLDARKMRALAFHIISVTVLAVLFLLVGASLRTGGLFSSGTVAA